jgi:hypothetical protein
MPGFFLKIESQNFFFFLNLVIEKVLAFSLVVTFYKTMLINKLIFRETYMLNYILFFTK